MKLLSKYSIILSIMMGLGVSKVAAQTVPVIVQPAEVIEMSTRLDAVGDLLAYDSIVLTPVVSKTIAAIKFNDGDRVTRGQVLVEMTSGEERALLVESQTLLMEAERQLERLRSLKKSQSISQSMLDTQQHLVESLRAKTQALSARLSDLVLTAPFAGQVGLKQVSVGALVSPGSEITTLVDDSKMKLDFSVPSVHLSKLTIGMPVKATSRSLGDTTFIGNIYSINNQIDVATRSIRVRAILDNTQHQLKQGMLMLVTIDAGVRQALAISETALVPLGGNNFVFVIAEQDGKTIVKRRAIKIGERMPGIVEVLDGLNEGDRVVTRGLQRIRDGQAVNVTSEEAPAVTQLTSDVLQTVDVNNASKTNDPS